MAFRLSASGDRAWKETGDGKTTSYEQQAALARLNQIGRLRHQYVLTRDTVAAMGAGGNASRMMEEALDKLRRLGIDPIAESRVTRPTPLLPRQQVGNLLGEAAEAAAGRGGIAAVAEEAAEGIGSRIWRAARGLAGSVLRGVGLASDIALIAEYAHRRQHRDLWTMCLPGAKMSLLASTLDRFRALAGRRQ